MIDRNPTAGFWITVVLVVVLAGYPLSFGPACWISSRINVDQADGIPLAYMPMTWAMSASNRVPSALNWYAQLGSRAG